MLAPHLFLISACATADHLGHSSPTSSQLVWDAVCLHNLREEPSMAIWNYQCEWKWLDLKMKGTELTPDLYILFYFQKTLKYPLQQTRYVETFPIASTLGIATTPGSHTSISYWPPKWMTKNYQIFGLKQLAPQFWSTPQHQACSYGTTCTATISGGSAATCTMRLLVEAFWWQ